MMLNQMPAGRPEPQWTQYDPGSDFEDCEYRVDEMEILGVKQKYIIIRGTIMIYTSTIIYMPEGINVYNPFSYGGFVIEYDALAGENRFYATTVAVNNYSYTSLKFSNMLGAGSRFLLFARVK